MLLVDQLNKGDRPLRMVAWGIAVGLFILLAGLWRVQVMSATQYREKQEVQSFRTVRVPAMRGKILDRNGRELVGNSPRYRLSLYLDELRPQFQEEYRRQRTNFLIAKRLDVKPAPEDFPAWLAAKFRKEKRSSGLTVADIDHLNRSARYAVASNAIVAICMRMNGSTNVRFCAEEQFHNYWLTKRALPMPVIEECTPAQIASITERGWSVPGARLELVPVRSYPNGKVAVHLVGHLRRDDNFDEDEGRFNYRQRDYVGAIGLERAYDQELRGIAGAKSIMVNSLGYRHQHGEQELAEPQAGLNLATTLDLELQKTVERSLDMVSGDERGAVVVMDVTNGDIVAMASAPAFDPTEFIDGVTWQRWTNVLLAEPARPMFNRATYGEYAPGSTFKVLHALALLEDGVDPAAAHTVAADPSRPGRGAYFLGRRKIEDTAPPGAHDFRRAFIRSSNSYFIDNGLRLGWEKLLAMGHRFGLGEDAGICIEEVKSGDFPTMDTVQRRGWTAGNLANVSIGQEITLTPVQLAVAISAVANGGKVFWPRVVDRIEPGDPFAEGNVTRIRPGRIRSEIKVAERHFDVLRAAMRDDVSDSEGTGKAARLEGFAVCGKTGTAEIKGNGRKDKVTWFASFGPYEAPRYTVIVMVESGGSGGGTCAPVAKRIYEFLRDRERNPARRLATQ
jgi:penicillin-binding protein 2